MEGHASDRRSRNLLANVPNEGKRAEAVALAGIKPGPPLGD